MQWMECVARPENVLWHADINTYKDTKCKQWTQI